MSLGEAAIKLGLPCFACGADKRPVVETGFKAATTESARLTAMFDRPGAALIGVPTGEKSGIVIVDVDIRADRNGMDWLNQNSEALPQTRTHRTQSGGLHLVFRYPAGHDIRNSAGRVAPGVDVRANGGYAIYPPSPGYAVADPEEPADMPRWLIRACLPPEFERPAASPYKLRVDGGSPYGIAALERECEEIRQAPFGQQYYTLNSAALKIGALVAGGEIQEGIAFSALLSAGCSMASEPGRPRWTSREIEDKVRRAVSDGKSSPRSAPERPFEYREPQNSPPPDLDDEAYWTSLDAVARMSAGEWHGLEQRESGRAIPASDRAKAAAGENLLWVVSEPWIEAEIAPRPWIVRGYLMRGSVTVVSGPGSAGKSSLMVAWSSSLAAGKQFSGFKPGFAMRVGTYNVEDDQDEQKRRFSAMAAQMGIPVCDLMGRLAILGPSGVGTLLHMTPDGRLLVNTPVMDKLEAWVSEFRPDVLMLDPFVELHAEKENDNTAVRAVMARFRAMAIEHCMAVVILHHSSKGQNTPGDPDSLRGASSIVGAARVALTINVMTEQEAEGFAIPKERRRDYFRLDGAKSNYAPIDEAEWFVREVRELENGDAVAVAWPWEPPSVFRDLSVEQCNVVLDRIGAGYAPGLLYRPNQLGGASPRWVGNVLVQNGLTEEQAKKVVKLWLRNGLLVEKRYKDASEGKMRTGVIVDNTRRPIANKDGVIPDS